MMKMKKKKKKREKRRERRECKLDTDRGRPVGKYKQRRVCY
jgi:hypothetical protein